MSKRVWIILGVGLLAIIAAFLVHKYEVKPEIIIEETQPEEVKSEVIPEEKQPDKSNLTIKTSDDEQHVN
jgi:hypothetical protein